tara:strand:+ start:962 stop:1933 length:972 start_codon:yes stop_codon:yes gene_type:complete
MIISKTPYRLPISGGGTDIDFYYKNSGGHLISISIDQYVYVLLMPRLIDNNYLIQTTSTQFENSISKINHDLIRETLIYYKIKEKLHIGTYSTIPTRTGLGSSSAMVIGLINCINYYKNLKLSNNQIVKDAYSIERKICKIHGGWQDQIVSQYGGFLDIKISKKEKLDVNKIKITKSLEKIVNDNFLLVYTEIKRNSSKVILSQKKRKDIILKYYHKIKSFNKPILQALNKSLIQQVGSMFDQHWNLKKSLSNQITDKKINSFYDNLVSNFNICGGKLIGAGGGGFFLVCTKNKKKLIKKLINKKINYIDFKIEKNGSKIIGY